MYLAIGVRNFWRQRRRNFLTVISVMVGCAGLTSLGGFLHRWENTLRYQSIYVNQVGSFSIFKKDGFVQGKVKPNKFGFSLAEQKALQHFLMQDRATETVGMTLTMQGIVSNGCTSYPFQITGYDPILASQFRNRDEVKKWCFELLDYGKGKPLSDYPKWNVIGVARGLALNLGKTLTVAQAPQSTPIGDLTAYCKPKGLDERLAADANLQLMAITTSGQFNAVDTEIAHYFTTSTEISDYTRMTSSLSLVQDLYGTDRVSAIAVYRKDHGMSRDWLAHLKDNIKNDLGIDVDIYPWYDEIMSPVYTGFMGFLWMMGLFFCLLIGTAITISVVHLSVMSIIDRSQEIGTLKAIGYGQDKIAFMFTIETTVLGLVGCGLGLVVAFFANTVINALNIQYYPVGFSQTAQFWIVPDPFETAGIVAFVLFLVVFSGFVTSYHMAGKSCLQLLTQHE